MSDQEDAGGPRRVVIEMQGIDKRVLADIWDKMRQGQPLAGPESFIGKSMADHPEWFPFFETMDVLGGEDTMPDGSNPFAHVTFHILIGSQIFNQQPPEAELFYRMRLRKGDDAHDVIHMMINVFQRHLAWAAQHAGPDGQANFDAKAYGETLRSLWSLKTKKIWERLGYQVAPKRHAQPMRR